MLDEKGLTFVGVFFRNKIYNKKFLEVNKKQNKQ